MTIDTSICRNEKKAFATTKSATKCRQRRARFFVFDLYSTVPVPVPVSTNTLEERSQTLLPDFTAAGFDGSYDTLEQSTLLHDTTTADFDGEMLCVCSVPVVSNARNH